MQVLSYILSIFFYLAFGIILLVMHAVQWIGYNFFGYTGHHKTVKWMNWLLMKANQILGTTYEFSGREKIPKDVPIIFVSNHQSMFDISPLEYYLSGFHPKFISKKELGKGFPSVSYNLQKGGSVLIDRKDSKQALGEIKKLGEYIEENNYSAVIFPEGTRSRDGNMKPFKEMGLKILTKYAKSAYIVPITINNSWKLLKNGNFPLHLGTKFQLTIHEPFKASDYLFEELMKKTEETIKQSVISP